MIHVELDNILTEHEAAAQATKLFRQVDSEKEVVVITIDNHPAVALIDVAQLEALSGRSVTPVAPLVKPVSNAPAMMETPEPTPTQPETERVESNSTPLTPTNSLPDPTSILPPIIAASTTSSPLAEPLPEPESSLLPPLPSLPTPPAAAPVPAPAPEATTTNTVAQPAPTSPPASVLPELHVSHSEPTLPPEDLSNSSPLG